MSGATAETSKGTLSALGVLLRGEDPAGAAALSRDFPELAPTLAEVKVLGEARETEGHRRGGAKLARGYVELARLGLAAATGRAERLMAALPRRMRVAKRLKLYGGVLSAFSSAGVLSALALSQGVAALATASLGFSTSIVALVGEHMDQPLFGARKSLGELITELLDIEREIREQKLELFGMTGPVDAVAALTAARKANELAARLRVLEVIEGLKPDEPRGSADALLVAGKQVNDQSGPS